jgi:carboxypeptidase Taq
MSKDSYEKLKEKGKQIHTLSSVAMLLEWDQETKMPEEGATFRAQQIEHLSSIVHAAKTSDDFKKALERLIDLKTGKILEDALDDRKKGALREFRRSFIQEAKLPNTFVKKMAKANSEGIYAWQKAKKESRFETFLPHLETIIDLNRKKADHLGFKDHPYDALVDLYEPEMNVSKLDALFGELKPFLSKLTEKLAEKKPINNGFLSASFPIDEQMKFCKFVMGQMGVDPKRTRLDTSTHPFCLGLHPTDVRLTTHTSLTSFFTNISAVMHEGGHALYELGLPPEDYGTPLGEFCSMATHESQSRWWECFIGQGAPFSSFIFPKLQETFPSQLKGVTKDHFYEALNEVCPSFIRIFADEVTYILHIILRYEIEKDFIKGNLKAKDLPKVWNEKMKETLGIIPENDALGCLQDVHWSCGLIGYFPTYALGNLYAGALFETFQEAHPDWEKTIAEGDLSKALTFLREKIHRFGREHSPQTLIENATGKPLTSAPYISYLKKKYG